MQICKNKFHKNMFTKIVSVRTAEDIEKMGPKVARKIFCY